MKMLRARELPRQPWKNGGGETMEIAVYPPDASFDDFEWRISMAIVASDGPFSRFAGIDRTLTILEGGPLGLAIEGAEEVLLTAQSDPVSFAGDSVTSARLHGATVTDLNVMTRRGHQTHSVTPLSLKSTTLPMQGDGPYLLIVRSGVVEVMLQDQTIELARLDSMMVDATETASFAIRAREIAHLLMVDIKSAT